MKRAGATIQDDIPPVHVLEAAQNQDRKETEDLLAGFDRPGRGPKPASKERDFVDYYAKKKGSGGESGSGRPTSSSPAAPVRGKQADVSTVIVTRKPEGMPPWLAWAAAAALMLAFGAIVAWLATADSHPGATVPTAPSAATTITSATSPQQAKDDNVPPPVPADPTTTTTATTPVTVTEPAPTAAAPPVAPRASAKRDPRSGANGGAAAAAPRGTNATDDSKPPPRDDFIRDL